jgi:biopolymer transport protein ExbD
MSHGPASEGSSAEPNLTPLLDIVLQLLMFFMMCVNFVNEQVTGEVVLPESSSAIPLSKAETEVLFVNVKPFHEVDYVKYKPEFRGNLKLKVFQEGDPSILVLGEEYPLKVIEFQQWLKKKRRDLDNLNQGKDNVPTPTIILRAHGDLQYGAIFQLLTMCKSERFKNMKVRATIKAGA